ncbi:MAG: hypothetical protein ACOCTS_00405, partial [Thermodesulfobacteriota bacterium]
PSIYCSLVRMYASAQIKLKYWLNAEQMFLFGFLKKTGRVVNIKNNERSFFYGACTFLPDALLFLFTVRTAAY